MKIRRFFSIITVIALFFALIPIRSNAQEVEPQASLVASGTSEEKLKWELYSDGTLKISGKGAMKDYSPAGGGYTSWIDANLGYSFEGGYNDDVKKIVISSGITKIGNAAFDYCRNLVSVEIADTVTSVGDYAFLCCFKLSSVSLPDSITYIGMQAFGHCNKLTSITIPKNVSRINDLAFANCDNLQLITFTGNAPVFGDGSYKDVFENVTATVYYPTGNATWTASVMKNYGGDLTWIPYGVVETYAKFTSISTSLGGNIAMNFYTELSDDLIGNSDTCVKFTYAGKTIKVPLSQSKHYGDNVYIFSCPITSKNMTDEITAQVYSGSAKVGDSKTMAVDTYCYWVIANTGHQKTINLMKAMLNYGASAQKLFNYRTDDLANAGLSAADKRLGAVNASAYAHSRTGEESGIKPVSYSLLLDSETTIRVYFELTGNKTIDRFTFKVDGVKVTPVYKDGQYYIEKTGIAAHRLDDMHTFTCGNITITYGGLSYVNQVMTYYTSGTTFDMASALYAYSKAAESYIG